MVAVYKKAEWPVDVEGDAHQFAKAVRWAIRGLVRRCEDCGVEPIGELTIRNTALPDETTDAKMLAGLVCSYELELDLAAMSVTCNHRAVAAYCPAADCAHVEFDLDETRARDKALKHWSGKHASGEDHWS